MNYKRITSLALIMSLSAGIAVHAAVTPSPGNANSTDKKIEWKHKHGQGKMHFGMVEAAKQMGIDQKELEEARKNKKNFFELAKKKGYSEQQAKAILIKTKTDAINKMVTDGKITKEKGDEIIKKITEKVSKWDGTFKEHKRSGGFKEKTTKAE